MSKILIRADSSEEIGTGHVMRCLTLAKALVNSNAERCVEFICQELVGNINFLIEAQGFTVNIVDPPKSCQIRLDAEQTSRVLNERGAGLLIIDNYDLTDEWVGVIRSEIDIFIFAIDDLADRFLSVNALLNQNYLPNYASKYQELVPSDCLLFLGPEYALLREEFYETRKSLSKDRGDKPSIVVFFGGTDPTGETLKVLPFLVRLSRECDVNIITGASNKLNAQIERIASTVEGLNYHCQVDNISHYLSRADFSIGAGGSTCLERMFFLLPSIVVVTAENQFEATDYYHSEGLVENLGWSHSVTGRDVYDSCLTLIENPELLVKYQLNMQELNVGSKGAVHIAAMLHQVTSPLGE